MSDTLTHVLADRAKDRVMQSIKVIAASPCPVHRETVPCSCPAAMARLRPQDHIFTKNMWFCLILEELLLRNDHAWAYDGSKPSHDLFVAAEGLTPKHFIRQQLQSHPVTSRFAAPSGKIRDTIQAVLDLWLARNKQWRETYGSRDLAARKWRQDEYPNAPKAMQISGEAPEGIEEGTAMMIEHHMPHAGVEMRQGEHCFKAVFTKLHPADIEGRTPYGVCIEGVEYCHEGCEMGKALFEMQLEEAAEMALRQLEAREDENRYNFISKK